MSDRIDSIIDSARVDAQFVRLNKQIDNIIKKIKNLNSLAGQFNMGGAGTGGGGGGTGGSGGSGGRGRSGQAKTELDQLIAAIERLKASSSSATQLIAQYNDQIARNARENRTAAAVNNTTSDSLNGMRARLNQLLLTYDNLTRSQRRNRDEGGRMLNQIRQLQREIRLLEFSTGRFGRNVGNYPRVVGGIKSLFGAFGVSTGVYGLKQVIDEKAIISDRLSDLQRLMGLTADEADKLYASFKKLDSRTGLDHLLEVAAVAARAGVGKDAIVGITQAIDQLVVVLGKDLGDADQITGALVKIVNIYSKDGLVTGEALQKIGNGLLTLSHSGVSTAPFIVDYTQRLAGLAKTANVALKSALGLGAGFEELGQSSEVAGTATVQIITKIAANVPKFSRIAGKSVEDFSKTLRNDPVEALLQVAQGLTKGAKGFDEIATAFKDSEARGIRVIGVLGALGSRADFFRQKIEIAGKALQDTSNIQEQFEIKNNNLAASYARLGKAAENIANDPNSGLGKMFNYMFDNIAGAIVMVDALATRFDKKLGKKIDISNRGLADLANGYTLKKNFEGTTTKYDTDSWLFSSMYQKRLKEIKSENDEYVKMFATLNEKEQAAAFRGLKLSVEEMKFGVGGDDIFRRKKGQYKPEDFDPEFAYQKEADRLLRISKIILEQRRKPLPPGERYEPEEKEPKVKQSDINAAARLREREIKAQYDADRFDLQTKIEKQEEILSNEKLSLDERMEANKKYYALKNELADLDTKEEKERIKVELGINKASKKELETADRKQKYEEEKNWMEFNKNVIKIIEDSSDEETRAILTKFQKRKTEIEKQQNEELSLTKGLLEQKRISEEQYEDEKLRIKNKYDILELQAEMEVQERILQILKNIGSPVEEQEAKLLELKNKLRALDFQYFDEVERNKTKRFEEEQKKRQELAREEISMLKQLSRESIDAIFSIIDGQFEGQRNVVQTQIDDLDKKTQKEIDAVNRSTDSEQNKADKIAIINARSAAQKEALERRQKQIDLQKARFDRMKSIGEVVAGTAVNLVKVFPNPVLMALAGAIGAAQLAQVLATPLPRYRHGAGVNGRPAHKGGIAQVNDGGKLEVLQTPSGQAYVAQGMNAYVDMPAGTKVYPSFGDYYGAVNSRAFRPIPIYQQSSTDVIKLTDHMTNQYQQQTQQLIAGMERNKSVMIVQNTHSGMKASQKHASGIIDYQNRNVFN